MARTGHAGFSLVELAIVLVVLGLVIAFSLPGVSRYNEDLALRGATDQIANAMQLTRTRAISTRTSRTMQFQAGYSETDYRVEVNGVFQSGWTLPKRISYAWLSGTISSVTMTPNGLCSTSGLIILQNTRGVRDTVSILSSGLVMSK